MRLFLGLHEYIHLSCGYPCTQLQPTVVPWEGKPDYVKEIHVVVWTAAVPEPGVFGALWVSPEAQVPLEIITVP